MAWWSNNKLRLIQNNLREQDANLDVGALIGKLKGLGANALMMNAGGIIAFYPTKLEYHYRAAGQSKDLLREALEQAHANGMKVIARFDFSKAHERIFAKKPEWFYRTKDGREVNYHGIVHSCISSDYQQEYSLRILNEVLSNYEVDGIFFNWFGYNTRDYDGNDYGICHCESCKTKFREMFGLELPEKEDPDDPVYQKHLVYREATAARLLDNVHALVKSKNRDIAISTYSEHKIDIVRKESNTDKARPHPLWLYSASENVKSVMDSYDDKLVSNCCINAIDLVHRFHAVSKYEVGVRLKEGLASGSGLDFCIIGVFEGYPDRENLPAVAEVFNYHKKNEAYYGNFQSMAEVALIKPESKQLAGSKEYFGLFKMLKEEHVLFDVLLQKILANDPGRIRRYRAAIIPDIAAFSREELQALEAFSREGGCLIGTGRSFASGDENRRFLKEIFGVELEEVRTYSRESAYLMTDDKEVFRRFPDRDWIFLEGSFCRMRHGAESSKYLPLVEPALFGPPERAFGHVLSGDVFGLGVAEERKAVILPWQAGDLYYRYGFEDCKRLLRDLLDRFAGLRFPVRTNAPQNVELFFNRLGEDAYIVHLLNLSGFNGVSYFEPAPIPGVELHLPDLKACRQLINLTEREEVGLVDSGQGVRIKLPLLKDFAAFVVET